jgi:hypothetical protein
MTRRIPTLLVGALIMALSAPAAAVQDRTGEAALAAMRALDLRVAVIGHRLALANLGRC